MNDDSWREKSDELWKFIRETQKIAAKENREIREQQKKTDELIEKVSKEQKKTDEQMKKTDDKLKRLSEELGGMGNNNGSAAEDFFWNALRRVSSFQGIPVDYSDRNVQRSKGNLQDEFDILLWNGSSIVLVEVKYKVHPNEVKKIKEKKIPNFRKLFPRSKEQKLYVALAGLSIPEDAEEEAKENGFFVLKQSGENLIVESNQVKAY